MFVVISTYLKSPEEMAPYLTAQADWLREHHENGHFVASGSKVPRSGGLILVQALTRESLEQLLTQAPLAKAKAARYEIVEMQRNMLWG